MVQIHCKVSNKDAVVHIQEGHLVDGTPINEENKLEIIRSAVSKNSTFLEIATTDIIYQLNKTHIYSIVLDDEFDLDAISTVWGF